MRADLIQRLSQLERKLIPLVIFLPTIQGYADADITGVASPWQRIERRPGEPIAAMRARAVAHCTANPRGRALLLWLTYRGLPRDPDGNASFYGWPGENSHSQGNAT